jgi:type IV pilus secretin PilQ/predicted competence protein
MLRQLLPLVLLPAALMAVPLLAGEPEEKTITLSVKEMEIKDVLEMLSVQRKLNIVATKDVAGAVTANLYNLSLDEALDAILSPSGFTFTRRGKVISVSKPAEKALLDQSVFHLKWATAAEMVTVLTPFCTKEGKVVKSETGDSVVVRDTTDVIQQMGKIIEQLDRQPQQVMIEAQMIEIGETSLKNLGFNWSSLDSLTVLQLTAETNQSNNRIDLGHPSGNAFSLRAGILNENQFTVLASLFNTLTDKHIVSQPRVMTLDAKKATMIVGTIVPVPLFDFAKDTGVRTLSGFQDERVGTEIDVTPHIREGNYILLDVTPKVESITDYITVGGDRQRPIKSTRSAQTQVMVKDGQTMVIGGLRDQTRKNTGSHVPYLVGLPLLGSLFKNNTNDLTTTELIIFITPRIVTDANVAPREEEIRQESDNITMQPVWRKDRKR